MTKVKICGITNLEDARHAVECGVDMLGFNFYRGSKRFVEPAVAAEIVSGLDGADVAKVGVFVNAEITEIAEVAKEVRLDGVQLHGDEDFGFVSQTRKQLGTKTIKCLRVNSGSAIPDPTDYACDAVLLDSYSPRGYGGTGEKFSWDVAKEIRIFVPNMELYLAGGLTAENVAEAIRTVRPYAVDVASGVEFSPGKKDPAKVAAFIKAAKEAL
jgi:phosphoribosylanthranilate isomerase